MGCERIEELLPLYLDEDATDAERRIVEEHLAACSACSSTLQRLRRLNRMVAAWPDVPDELRPHLATIDARVRQQVRRERLLVPALFAMRRTLSFAVSAAIILVICGLGLTLLLMGSQLGSASQTLTAASSRVSPVLAPLHLLASPSSPLDQAGLDARQLPDVVKITVLDYRKTSNRTVTDHAKIEPVLNALADARFVRHDPGLQQRVLNQTYIVLLGLKSGSIVSLSYLPNGQGPNVEDPGSQNWWQARGLDAAMLPLLPSPPVGVDVVARPSAVPTAAPSAVPSGGPRPTDILTTPLHQLPAPVMSLAADPTSPRLVYALLITNALYRSDDAGQTWRQLPLPAAETPYALPLTADQQSALLLMPRRDIAVAATTHGRVFVVAEHVLYASEDGGAAWKPLDDAVYAWTMADPAGNVLYVWHGSAPSEPSGLYRSGDAGATWSQVYATAFPPLLSAQHCPCSHEGIGELLADPRNPNAVDASSDYGIFQSGDGGQTWQGIAGSAPSPGVYRWTPLLAGGSDGTMDALVEASPSATPGRVELVRRRPGDSAWSAAGEDSLAAWQDPSAPMYGFSALVADPVRPGRLYLGSTRGLLVSDDAGASWQLASLPAGHAVYQIAVAPSSPSASRGGSSTRLYVWTDAGFVVWGDQ